MTALQRLEDRDGVPLPTAKVLLGQAAYDRARYRGLGPCWVSQIVQMLIVTPLALHPASASIGLFMALLGRELIT